MYKVIPMNRKVLVEFIGDTSKEDAFKNEFGLIIPKVDSTRNKVVSDAKYLFKVLGSNNPLIKEGMIILSDTTNKEELTFRISDDLYKLTFIDEYDIVALLVNE